MGEKVGNIIALAFGVATVAVIFKSRFSAGIIGSGGKAIANVILSSQHG